MTMTKAAASTIITPTDEADLQNHILDMIEAGETDAAIIRATRVPLSAIRELRAASGHVPAGAAGATGVVLFQKRADRERCECGAFQSEHDAGGSGKCLRTLCTEFASESA